jgi:hypothetical protein
VLIFELYHLFPFLCRHGYMEERVARRSVADDLRKMNRVAVGRRPMHEVIRIHLLPCSLGRSPFKVSPGAACARVSHQSCSGRLLLPWHGAAAMDGLASSAHS